MWGLLSDSQNFMQQGNDPKAANLQQSGWEKRIKVLQWPSQSSDLNLI